MMFVIAWIIFFILMIVFFVAFKNDKGHFEVQGKVITISPDSLGHYHFEGMINDKRVEFLVDTGASLVAIPASMSTSLKLEKMAPITIQTANGKTNGFLTRVYSLTIGPFQFSNVKAVIIPDNDSQEVLLGMNVLSKFNLSQQNGKLIIKK